MSGYIPYFMSRASTYWLLTGVGSMEKFVGGLLVELPDAERGGVDGPNSGSIANMAGLLCCSTK